MVCHGLYHCPLGQLVIGWDSGHVVSLHLADSTGYQHCPSRVSDLAAQQINEYLDGVRTDFDFPIRPSGTPFQIDVWSVLRQIPYGETRTYGQIAAMLGNPKAARAVGQAANRNPLWIVIPCHRVLGKDHALTGYAGGLDLKQTLLNLEQRNT